MVDIGLRLFHRGPSASLDTSPLTCNDGADLAHRLASPYLPNPRQYLLWRRNNGNCQQASTNVLQPTGKSDLEQHLTSEALSFAIAWSRSSWGGVLSRTSLKMSLAESVELVAPDHLIETRRSPNSKPHYLQVP